MQMFASDFVYKIETIEFAINNQVDNRFQMFHWVLWIFKQYCDALDFCIPIIQFDGKFLYYKKLWYSLNCHYTRWKQLHFTDCFHYCRRRTLDAWSWFLGNMQQHMTKKQGLCLISDRFASIKATMVNPHLDWQSSYVYYIYCICHIASNFNHKFKNTKLKQD